MAMCEKCGLTGYNMKDMRVDTQQQFVGPCCFGPQIQTEELEYGIEISSHTGIHVYANYKGLSLQFKKTKEEIQQWMEASRIVDPPEETQNQSQPMDPTPIHGPSTMAN